MAAASKQFSGSCAPAAPSRTLDAAWPPLSSVCSSSLVPCLARPSFQTLRGSPGGTRLLAAPSILVSGARAPREEGPQRREQRTPQRREQRTPPTALCFGAVDRSGVACHPAARHPAAARRPAAPSQAGSVGPADSRNTLEHSPRLARQRQGRAPCSLPPDSGACHGTLCGRALPREMRRRVTAPLSPRTPWQGRSVALLELGWSLGAGESPESMPFPARAQQQLSALWRCDMAVQALGGLTVHAQPSCIV